MFALLVPTCCNKFGTSCSQHVTSLMTLSDLLQGCSYKSDENEGRRPEEIFTDLESLKCHFLDLGEVLTEF